MNPDPDPDLRSQLAGTCGLLLDMDGVLVLRNELIPGATDALARFDAAGMPYLLATNTSLVNRSTLSRELGRAGLTILPDRIISAVSAAAAYTRRHYPGRPLYVMGAPDALAEFEGQNLLSYDEAARPEARVEAVVVGDAAEEFSPRNLQSAFAMVRNGARLLAMHKNRWWLTPAGVMLDAGAYVVGLEYATGKRALVTGKPARTFFLEGVRRLDEIARASAAGSGQGSGGGLGGAGHRPLSPGEVVMVGDDLWNDIRGAQGAGLRGVFVRSGKHGDAELARLSAERGTRAPDAVAASIVEIAAALVG